MLSDSGLACWLFPASRGGFSAPSRVNATSKKSPSVSFQLNYDHRVHDRVARH